MSKKEFIEAYAKKTGETKKRSEELVNTFLSTVEDSLLKGDRVQFVGWGTYDVVDRKPRKARNPKTDEVVKVPAKRVVKFKAGKKLADKVAAAKVKKSSKKK